jgi:hypothetical protein
MTESAISHGNGDGGRGSWDVSEFQKSRLTYDLTTGAALLDYRWVAVFRSTRQKVVNHRCDRAYGPAPPNGASSRGALKSWLRWLRAPATT